MQQGWVTSLILLLTSLTLLEASAEPVVPGLSYSGETDLSFAGRVLLSELNCTACHRGKIQSKGAPVLNEVGKRIHPEYLEQFIASPGAIKPGTTMPNLLRDLPEAERKAAARAIADYLSHRGTATFALHPIDPKRVESGKTLYHEIGCVACHSPEGKNLPDSSPLDGMEKKYSLASLTDFLEDPLAVRPGGRMPDLNLSHWEALDLANYLLRDQVGETPENRKPEHSVEGEVLFRKYGCAQCHEPTDQSPDFAKPLADLSGSKSCSAADFSLSDSQKLQIAAALKSLDKETTPETDIHLNLTRLNCLACHQRGENGGPSPERDAWFTTSNLNLGEQARVPPSLNGVGAKLDPGWMRKVLVSGARVRPYLNTRMPKFGEANVEPLLAGFAAVDRLPTLEFERVADQKTARESGHQLAGDKNLSCVACHTWLGESATTLNGVELSSMTERLQENWFHHYLRNPQNFHPTTIMPNFWPGGKPVRPELLDGDTGKQIDAIWQYLSRGKEAQTPSGIRREPIEYGTVNGEAVMLRRQYNGIGKRGIGVGYPMGINLSFDAGQLRLGSIWQGGFGEMSGVWRGQGSGNVNEPTREIVRFPLGPAFAILNSAESSWPVLEKGQRAPAFQFLGYSLDEKQRPAFRYTFSGLTITDRSIDEAGKLVRTLTFDQPAPENLYFRAAADRELKSTEDETVYLLPRGLTIKLPQKGILRRTGELSEWLLPLSGESTLVIEYRFPVK